jgi:hypothetical protein
VMLASSRSFQSSRLTTWLPLLLPDPLLADVLPVGVWQQRRDPHAAASPAAAWCRHRAAQQEPNRVGEMVGNERRAALLGQRKAAGLAPGHVQAVDRPRAVEPRGVLAFGPQALGQPGRDNNSSQSAAASDFSHLALSSGST